MSQSSYNFTFQDPSGKPLALGSATFRLTQDAQVVNTAQIVRGTLVTAALDSNGSVTILLWPTNQLVPATVYTVRAYSANGLLAFEEQMSLT
jgi:hypothetical protein